MSKLTEASPSLSPSNPTSLRETYVGYKTGKQILSSTEIQDQGLTRSRPKTKSEKGKQRPVHYKHAEMERLRTLVSIHPHEEVPNPDSDYKAPAPTSASILNTRPRAIEISGPHKQEYCDTSGLIQGACILHKTLVSIHPHEEVPNPDSDYKAPAPTSASILNTRPRAIEISGPHKQEYCDTSGLIQGACILHKKQHAARELDSDQFPNGRMRNPNKYR
ncbi:hypothetical protein DY000_02022350 [Brassica cretica]|uniref:Uncharacterized protein n=1 Tax=Brassica cretica TaxID=69181 RepID=A0ABQ7EKS0_BRACR|nr:hypothetical protein DY000_02022350 [Brassica cretica]